MIVCIFIGIVIGLEFLVTAGMEHTAFVKAHPYIEDFYTEDERARARRNMAQACVAGVGLIFVGCACIIALGEYPSTEREGLCLLMLFIAAGSWLIIRYGMLLGRTNVVEYNRSVADDLELEDIASAQLDDARREELLRRKRKSDRLGAVCATIMIVNRYTYSLAGAHLAQPRRLRARGHLRHVVLARVAGGRPHLRCRGGALEGVRRRGRPRLAF